jgi:hypothetical protein
MVGFSLLDLEISDAAVDRRQWQPRARRPPTRR